MQTVNQDFTLSLWNITLKTPDAQFRGINVQKNSGNLTRDFLTPIIPGCEWTESVGFQEGRVTRRSRTPRVKIKIDSVQGKRDFDTLSERKERSCGILHFNIEENTNVTKFTVVFLTPSHVLMQHQSCLDPRICITN